MLHPTSPNSIGNGGGIKNNKKQNCKMNRKGPHQTTELYSCSRYRSFACENMSAATWENILLDMCTQERHTHIMLCTNLMKSWFLGYPQSVQWSLTSASGCTSRSQVYHVVSHVVVMRKVVFWAYANSRVPDQPNNSCTAWSRYLLFGNIYKYPLAVHWFNPGPAEQGYVLSLKTV